jgi:heterodisulfide reductase subunit C
MNQQVVFEAKQDPKFLETMVALPEGERLYSCIQCGSCGGTCPVSKVMPHTPRRIFAMVRAGLKQAVLESMTPWVCASCYSCTVNCPAGIKITEIMYALKRMAIKAGVKPAGSDAYRFASLFTDAVAARGRASELEVMMKYMMFHHPGQLFAQSGLGIDMMRKGRMPILPHSVRGLESFHKMVARARELEETQP